MYIIHNMCVYTLYTYNIYIYTFVHMNVHMIFQTCRLEMHWHCKRKAGVSARFPLRTWQWLKTSSPSEIILVTDVPRSSHSKIRSCCLDLHSNLGTSDVESVCNHRTFDSDRRKVRWRPIQGGTWRVLGGVWNRWKRKHVDKTNKHEQ